MPWNISLQMRAFPLIRPVTTSAIRFLNVIQLSDKGFVFTLCEHGITQSTHERVGNNICSYRGIKGRTIKFQLNIPYSIITLSNALNVFGTQYIHFRFRL